jgi:hypothetical protein
VLRPSFQPPRCHRFRELPMIPVIILLESQHTMLKITEIQRRGDIIKAI